MKFKKRLKKIKSINTMIWRYMAVFTVIIVAVVAVVCYFVLGNAYLRQARNRVTDTGIELTNFINDSQNSDRMVADRVRNYNFSSGIGVLVISADGQIVLPTSDNQPDDFSATFEKITSSLNIGNTGKYIQYNYDGFENFASAITYNSKPHYLLVRYSVSLVTQSVRQMQIYVWIIALAAILVAFVVSYIMAQKLSKPLKDLSDTAAKLGKGDYSVKFASAEYQEIAKLSDTLNYAKDEIKKSDDFQKELLANVSHDFKTPLTMIKAYASMIKEISGDNPEKRDKHLQVIIDEADRLTGLVNDVLNTSKISSGIDQLNKKVFNLTEYLYSILNKFEYLQETQGYTFMVDIDSNLYTLADEEKIGQVIYNLLSNAVNYTGSDKTIYVSLKDIPEENRIRFAVRDTGKGIAQEELEHIWDRYYRSKDAHLRPVKGTGLGLNIVKFILQSHAFDFGVTSNVGEGSTFYVDFPAVSSTPTEE